MARRAQRGSNQMVSVPVKHSTTILGGGVSQQGVPYAGGLDLTTPSLSIQPGALRAVQNFECSITGGYSRVVGYERFDGQPSPSLAVFIIVQVDAFTNVPAVGDVITQAGSGATGTVAFVYNEVDGTYMVVTDNVGVFANTGEITTPGPTVIGDTVPSTQSLTPEEHAIYMAASADVRRAVIAEVPGSGGVTGVFHAVFGGVAAVYAFRANVGGTAVDLYKSSPAGWVQVPFYDRVAFTAGGASQPAEGDTLTQGGVTATIKRVVDVGGTWAGSTAAGVLVIDDVAGGNFAAGAATITGGISVTLSGAQTGITFLTGGKFEIVKDNFTGTSGTRRAYGVDGVNQAWEFDGDVLAPIPTGFVNDAPEHVAVHQNSLFLSLESSLIFSGAGTPYRFLPVDGGGEIAAGDQITCLLRMPGSSNTASLAVFLKTTTSVLYGTGVSTYNYVTFNDSQGAVSYSAKSIFDAFVFESTGVVKVSPTLNFGNFEPTDLTKNLLPFIKQQVSKVVASSINTLKGQYRAFFSDGYGLWTTMVNKTYMGAGVVFFPDIVSCCDTSVDTSNNEVSFFGCATSGFVYQMDMGTSFDGAEVDAYITLPWDAFRSSEILKTYRGVSIEMQGDGYAVIQFGYQLGYGSDEYGEPDEQDAESGFSAPPAWDSFTWDNFYWDGRTIMPTRVPMEGDAENVQVTIRSGTNYIQSYTINSLTYHYSMRRGIRP